METIWFGMVYYSSFGVILKWEFLRNVIHKSLNVMKKAALYWLWANTTPWWQQISCMCSVRNLDWPCGLGSTILRMGPIHFDCLWALGRPNRQVMLLFCLICTLLSGYGPSSFGTWERVTSA